jgi:hypothetical protein
MAPIKSLRFVTLLLQAAVTAYDKEAQPRPTGRIPMSAELPLRKL